MLVKLHLGSIAVVRRFPLEAQGLSLGVCSPHVTATVGASARFSQGWGRSMATHGFLFVPRT